MITEGGLRVLGRSTRRRGDGGPVVSVITTVFNAVFFIEHAIRSVLDQTYPNVEYIIIDAGSTDGTVEVIKSYEDRIDYFLSESDSGIYAGMNKGLELASGEFIIFLNADDYYVPDAIEKLVAHAQKSGSDIVAAHSKNVDAAGNRVAGGLCRSTWTDYALLACPLKHETMLVRREVYDRIGRYDESMKISADWFWMAKAYKAGCTVSIIDEELLVFRLIGTSANKELQNLHADERMRGYGILFDGIRQEDVAKLRYLSSLKPARKDELKASNPECLLLHRALDSTFVWGYASGQVASLEEAQRADSVTDGKGEPVSNGYPQIEAATQKRSSVPGKPLVSIVTTVLNGAEHIEQSIQSVLSQTYPHIEYIITDGASTDGTLGIIERYADRIDRFVSERDSGLYAGMNKGIRLATGDYILVLNADDYFRSDAVELLVAGALDTGAPIVAAHAVFVQEDGRFLRIERSTADDRLFLKCTIRHEAMLVHKSVYDDLGLYDETLRICSDWMWILKAYEKYHIHIVDEPILIFRASGLSAQTSKLHDQEKIAYLRQLVPNFDPADIEKLRYPHHLQCSEIPQFLRKYSSAARFCHSLRFFSAVKSGALNGDVSHPGLTNSALELLLQNSQGKRPLNLMFVVWGLQMAKGGLERVGVDLANEMARRGHSVTVVCPDFGNPPSYPLHRTVRLLATSFYDNPESRRQVRELILSEYPDVCVPMFSWNDLLRWPVMLRGTGIPMLISEHNDPAFIENVKWNRRERLACMEAADLIHVLCQRFKASIPSVLQERVNVIPNPVHPVTVQRDRLRDTPARRTIISVGHYVKHKQHGLLIDAFALIADRFPDWDVAIWGEGALAGPLKEQVQRLGLERRIALCGRTDSIEEEYAKADLMCHPAAFEGFGLVVAEAMAQGLPVVGFAACSGVNEIIIDRINGRLVQVMTATALADALAELMKDSDRRALLGDNARRSIKRYDPQTVYDQWEQLLVRTSRRKGRAAVDSLPPESTMVELCLKAAKGKLLDEASEAVRPTDNGLVKAEGERRAFVRAVIGYDQDWQYPAITEKHAFEKARELIAPIGSARTVYFGFPWATLMDKVLHATDKSQEITEALQRFKPQLAGYERIVTVCQHIHMLKFQSLLQEMGVTDVFWSHAAQGQLYLPECSRIKIHPFPLYPVQAIGVDPPTGESRDLLYSFVGARAAKFYLTESRNIIIDELTGDLRGFVSGRADWHYNKVVYDLQVRERVSTFSKELLNESAAEEFVRILQRSVFSLCPSGSGPNSIRLWESIGLGAIPVVLADTYQPPRNPTLWEAATVICPETPEAIKALPGYLEQLAREPQWLENKRAAMRELWRLYGPDCFIADILPIFERPAQRPAPVPAVTATLSISYDFLLESVGVILGSGDYRDDHHVFTLGCITRLLTDPATFTSQLQSRENLRAALKHLIRENGSRKEVSMLKKLMAKHGTTASV